MIYCNAFGFIPAFAKLVQNVWRRVWGVVTFGKASSWLFLFLVKAPSKKLADFT